MGEEPSDCLREAEGSLMDSQEKQFLNAEEVEGDLAIIRHPNARQKRRNRSGQAAGISKRHIPDQFNWRLVEMQKSPAYRILSLSARKILDRLEIELAQHGFKPEENGLLPCTYDDFVEYGVDRHAIAPGIREVVALGFVEVTRKGSAGNEDHRQATLFLLTYRPSGSDVTIKNGWLRIKTIEEAEAVAKAARSKKGDARARDFGRRGGWARWRKNKSPVMENALSPVMENALKGQIPSDGNHTEGGKSPVMETEPLSRVSQGGSPDHSTGDATTVPAVPFAWTLPLADLFPPQSPNDPYAGLLLCLRAPTAAEILKGILH
jgi:hypothetical protein